MIATHPYVPSPEQQQREYRQRFPSGYVPREDSLIVLTDQEVLKKRVVKSTALDITEADAAKTRQVLIERAAAVRLRASGSGRQRLATSRSGRIGILLRTDPSRIWTTHEIAAEIDNDIKSVRSTLDVLMKRGEIEQLPKDRPNARRRYRAVEVSE